MTEHNYQMAQIVSGFNQERLWNEYHLGYREAHILRWFLTFLSESERLNADIEEGYVSKTKMEYIVHPDSRERYYWVSLEYLMAQWPSLGITRTATFSQLLNNLTGEFNDADKTLLYPLKKFMSSKSGQRKIYFRATTAVDYLMGHSNDRVQAGIDRWKNDKEVKKELFSDKKALSLSFISLYEQISAIFDFRHKLPQGDQEPSKILLQAQEQITAFLDGSFLDKNKYNSDQGTDGYVASERAILRAVERYANLVEGGAKYTFSLASFFYNPLSGRSMVLSMLSPDVHSKDPVVPVSSQMIRTLPTRQAVFLFELGEQGMVLSEAVIEKAQYLCQWYDDNHNDLTKINAHSSTPLDCWQDFQEGFVKWVSTWKDPQPHLLSCNSKTWQIFETKSGWDLTVTPEKLKKYDDDRARRRERAEANKQAAQLKHGEFVEDEL